MNFYDKVHELVRSLKETNEYKEYINLKNIIKQNKQEYDMIKDFKDKQNKLQLKHISGTQMTDDEKKEMENLYSIIIGKENLRKLLELEMKLDIMLADMQKIVGEGIKEIVEF